MLKLLLFVSLLVVSTSGLPRLASAEQSSVESCADQAIIDLEDPETCIGRIFSPCLEALKDDSSAHDKTACYSSETRFWDKILNEQYKGLMTRLCDSIRQKELSKKQLWQRNVRIKKTREAQRIWLRYRDTTCQLPLYMVPGSVVQVSAASCMTKTTARRAILIMQWRIKLAGQ